MSTGKFDTFDQIKDYAKKMAEFIATEAYRKGWEDRDLQVKNRRPVKEPEIFIKPSMEEVMDLYTQTYGDTTAEGRASFAAKWFGHYEHNKWKVGGKTMTDWKMSVERTWDTASTRKNADYFMQKYGNKQQENQAFGMPGMFNEF